VWVLAAVGSVSGIRSIPMAIQVVKERKLAPEIWGQLYGAIVTGLRTGVKDCRR